MNPLWTGFDPDVAKAIAILGALIAGVIVAGWWIKPRPPLGNDHLPFPPLNPTEPQLSEPISSGEALRRMIGARAKLMQAVRDGNRPAVRDAAYSHSGAVADYMEAIGREITR